MVAAVGNSAITQSEVEREFRFELFLAGKIPNGAPSAAQFSSALDRLISQRLLRNEVTAGAVSEPAAAQGAEATLEQVRKSFPTDSEYQEALAALGMTENQARERLRSYEITLDAIDQHFRGEVAPRPEDIETYYRTTFLPEYAQHHTAPAPALRQVAGQIRDILVQKKINQLLAAWLKDLKEGRGVKIFAGDAR